MDEFADYSMMKPSQNKKWSKISKLIKNDPESKLVLIAVPKGFKIEDLNTLKMSDDKQFDYRKRVKKAKEGKTFSQGTLNGSRQCVCEIHSTA